MRKRVEQIRTVVRGARTVLKRRGPGYFGYLITAVVVPRVLYSAAWAPTAPARLRAAFGALVRATVASASDTELRTLGLVEDPAGSSRAASAEEIERLMDRAHAARVTGVRHAFDLAIRTAGDARFSAMPLARLHAARDSRFLAERDADRRAFNRRFGTALLTEHEARVQLQSLKASVPPGYRDYAPIDFGGGLTVGQVASTDSGTGRWEFFNRNIVAPLVAGKRVLDLGSNNGSLPLMMARAGAREVVGIEVTPQIADFARFNARILSWRDVRPYTIEIITGDMRLFLTRDLGRFDVVTAFCSIYYLPEDDIARIIRKASQMGATLILQANEAIANLPAQPSQLRSLMEVNGYSHVDTHQAPGFARPLLVGRSPFPTQMATSDLVTNEAALG